VGARGLDGGKESGGEMGLRRTFWELDMKMKGPPGVREGVLGMRRG
jgi:hypothetical protein